MKYHLEKVKNLNLPVGLRCSLPYPHLAKTALFVKQNDLQEINQLLIDIEKSIDFVYLFSCCLLARAEANDAAPCVAHRPELASGQQDNKKQNQ